MRLLPTFFVIGASKAGTSSLHEYLRVHPQVFLPARREPAFFVTERNWGRGWEWYEAQFKGGELAIARGDVTPAYSYYPIYSGVPGRIAASIRDPRFVYLVRDPIERIQSMYVHRRTRTHDRETLPIDEAVLTVPEYIETCRYGVQIEQYLTYFGRERILVVISEQFRSQRARAMKEILGFIGVDDRVSLEALELEHNRSIGKTEYPDRLLRLRQTRIVSAAWATLPRRLASNVRQATGRVLPPDSTQMRPETERTILRMLRDDLLLLRDLLPEEFDCWGRL